MRQRGRKIRRRATRYLSLGAENLEDRLLLTSSSAAISQFPIPAGSDAVGITTGSDGNLYFADSQNNSIDEINSTTHAISVFPIPTPASQPMGVTSVSKGNIYFTQSSTDEIGELNVTSHAVTEIMPFPRPTAGPPESPPAPMEISISPKAAPERSARST